VTGTVRAVAPRPFRFGVQANGPADPVAWRELARTAEDLGYSVLTMADHFDDHLAPGPALVAAAGATRTLRLGTLVYANDYRHPVVLAKEAATLDLLTDGRLELGMGAGWMTTDYDQAGIPLDAAGVRIARLEEAVVVVKALLAGDEPVTFAGEHYQVTDLLGSPAAVQRPHPPLVIGGGGRKVLSLAGRHADVVGINVNLAKGVIDADAGPDSTAAMTAEKVRWVRDAAGDRFDGIELQVRVHLAAITDDRQAMAEALADGFGLSPQEAIDSPHSLAGTVDQVVEDLQAMREVHGISYVGLSASSMQEMAPVVARLAGT
jgi:probable F420-dependent oxidoreductase